MSNRRPPAGPNLIINILLLRLTIIAVDFRYAICNSPLSDLIAEASLQGTHHDRLEWGLCKDCKWFQVEPVKVEDSTMGLCIEESLQHLRLRVSGNSGWNKFTAGEVA